MRAAVVTPTAGNKTGCVLELTTGRLVLAEFDSFAIYTSDDDGANWTTRRATAHPNAQPRIHFVDSKGYIYFSKGLAGQTGYIVRSVDNGVTWTTVHTNSTASPSQYSNALWHMIEDSEHVLYAQEYSFGTEGVTEGWQALNIYRSIDQGATWQKFFAHPNVLRHLHLLAIDSKDTIYYTGAHPIVGGPAAPAGEWRLSKQGIQQAFIPPMGLGGGMTAFAEAEDGALLFGSDNLTGIFRMDDNSFESVLVWADVGLTNDQILGLARGRFGVLYAACNVSGIILASYDDGRTWIALTYPTTFGHGRPTLISVGRGPIPYIYFDRSTTFDYYRITDFTRQQLIDLSTSKITASGSITLNG